MKDIDRQLQNARIAWLKEMKDFRDSLGCVKLPLAPMLTEKYLEKCHLLPNREAILKKMILGGVASEVGVQTGHFSKSILEICKPSKLHLIDIDLHSFSIKEKFKTEIEQGIVCVHEGDSSLILKEFPNGYFDFIYIDGDHSYNGVKKDIQVAKSKIKEQGFLIFDDYTYWSPAECMRYGVIQAVNELCIEENWEIIYFSLAHYMYCNVALRQCYNNLSESILH